MEEIPIPILPKQPGNELRESASPDDVKHVQLIKKMQASTAMPATATKCGAKDIDDHSPGKKTTRKEK